MCNQGVNLMTYSKTLYYSLPQGEYSGFQVSSDGDDRMEPKVKTQKNPYGFQQNPKKSLDQLN